MGDQVVTIATAIVGVAILAVLVSRNSDTANVIGAAGDAFAGALKTAVSPISGFTGGASGLAPLNFTGFGSGLGYGGYGSLQ